MSNYILNENYQSCLNIYTMARASLLFPLVSSGNDMNFETIYKNVKKR